jgi:hypothetical protein
MPKRNPFPTLEQFLKAGTIFTDNGRYIGVTDDGVEVELGTMDNETAVRAYLESHPTPSHW